MQLVGEWYDCRPESFHSCELFLETDNDFVPLSPQLFKTLTEANFYVSFSTCCQNKLFICDNSNPVKLEKTAKEEVKSYKPSFMEPEKEKVFALPNVMEEGSGDASATYVPPPGPPPYTPGQTDLMYNYSYSNAVIKYTGFVGLVNQAMTCYLNSLLQTLYMTPEFRNALYRWEFDDTKEDGSKSIPFQLQKLFLQLQTSNKPAVGTTELTTSFGWDSSEAWQQHDVQELCRVMFDALEQTFKNTGQAELISTLYEGKLKDYVKCLECGGESAREDTFLDVPLVVRPFGSNEAYGSVEEALHAFVTPEILQGCNQYFCERCSKKCDAHKGLKFLKFPYLLTLQLKRFDFDPLTMHRIKLNDKVTFPEILNLNDFIKEEKQGECSTSDSIDISPTLTEDTACSIVKPENAFTEDGSETMHHDDDDVIDVGMQNLSNCENNQEMTTNEKNLRKSMEKGPYMYELFSIMVHSGSANGGHYYAYIKSFKDGEWYSFNDAQVTRITYDDIQKTYGGGPARGYYSSAYSSSVNAYMLMYRQIDKAKNAEFISAESFPDHIKILLQNMIEQEERERQQREMDRYMVKIKLFCQHPVQRNLIELKLNVHRDCTLLDATKTARSIMGLESTVPIDCCRLVKYDEYNDSLECSFEGADDEPVGELLGGVKSSYKFDLLLEVKKPNEKFQEYKPGGTTIKLYIVNLQTEEVTTQPLTLRSHLSETVENFRNHVAKTLEVNANNMRLALEVYNNEVNLIDNYSATLKAVGFGKTSKVFVEFSDEEDAKIPFPNSKFHALLDCFFNTICIYVSLPKVEKSFIDKLRIYECEVHRDESASDEEINDLEDKGTMDVSFIPSKSIPDRQQVNTKASKEFLFHAREFRRELEKMHSAITPDDSSQDYDEGLGDSEIGDTCSTSEYQGCHAAHSDQSEDSSLTDSERTLVGDDVSPHNNSPDMMDTEMEIDVEPSHVLSPDVSRPDSDSAHSSSDSNFQIDDQAEDLSNPSSPEENTKDNKCCSKINCPKNSHCLGSSNMPQPIVVKRYFRAWPYTDCETREKMLRVYVDKRINLAVLKKELEPFVGVASDYFKIIRVYSNNQEFECSERTENLMSYTDETKLIIRLRQALRKHEFKVDIYQLCINETEPIRHLTNTVFVKGMTVLEAKKQILPELKESCGLEIPLNRCRLRKKWWKNPGTIFLDHQVFNKDIIVNTSWEVFVEYLSEAETVVSTNQLALFVRRWRPSTYTVDKLQEIVIEPINLESLKEKLSEISGIPKDQIEIAKGVGTFPCELSLLTIQTGLDWHSSSQTINTWTLTPGEDGYILYYRDSKEELKKLTDEEKREMTNKEMARSNKIHKTTCSPRKEKALKIYTRPADSVSIRSNNSSSSGNNSKLAVPDLD